MANQEHREILKQGVEQWNKWREENESIKPVLQATDLRNSKLRGANLSGANMSHAFLTHAQMSDCDLSGADLSFAVLVRADLSGSNLSGANLRFAMMLNAQLSNADFSNADLIHADLSSADLSGTTLCGANLSAANLFEADLSGFDLSGTNLSSANLSCANLSNAKLRGVAMYDANLKAANLTGADLTDADLSLCDLVQTDFTNATITGCRIYGASAWDVILEGTAQQNLIVSRRQGPVVTVDDLEVGQFIYLMLNNTKIRNVINTITSKGVLILGRFSDPQRKSVLDGLREKLREYDLLPMVFDFEQPTDRDYTETIQTLAGMSMFVIADLTNPKSTPLELEATVKQFKIPYIPIIDTSVDPRPFAMLVDSQKSFHWVLPTVGYPSKDVLLDDENLKTYIIDRANAKREELRQAKNQEPEMIMICKKEVTVPLSEERAEG